MTTFRLTNGTADFLDLQHPGECSNGLRVDGLALGEGIPTCDEALDGTIEIGDCEPAFAGIAPGDTLVFNWDRRTNDAHLLPADCDGEADDVVVEYCSRADAVPDGPHTARVTFERGDGAETRDFPFDLPAETVELAITDP